MGRSKRNDRQCRGERVEKFIQYITDTWLEAKPLVVNKFFKDGKQKNEKRKRKRMKVAAVNFKRRIMTSRRSETHPRA